MKIHNWIKKISMLCMYKCCITTGIIMVILGYIEINILSRKPGKYSFMRSVWHFGAAGSNGLNHCSSHCSWHLTDLLSELIHLTKWEEKKPFFFCPLWFSDVFMNWTSSLWRSMNAKACLKEVTGPCNVEQECCFKWQEAVSFTQIIHGNL